MCRISRQKVAATESAMATRNWTKRKSTQEIGKTSHGKAILRTRLELPTIAVVDESVDLAKKF